MAKEIFGCYNLQELKETRKIKLLRLSESMEVLFVERKGDDEKEGNKIFFVSHSF